MLPRKSWCLLLAFIIQCARAFNCGASTNYTRYFSENGVSKNIYLYWSNDPGRAASALLAVVLRKRLGYQQVYLRQGSNNLSVFAAEVPFTIDGQYNDVILALSTSWTPGAPLEWTPFSGKRSGLAGPRLKEYGASTLSLRQQLHVHVAKEYRELPECANVNQWSFYANDTAVSGCGFTNTASVGHTTNILIYGLESSNTAIKDNLQFQELDRRDLFQMLRTDNKSFLFYDYDMWSKSQHVTSVQLPPCIPGANDPCHQELDEDVAMRVTEFGRMEPYALDLFEFAHNFTPPYQYIREILELETTRNSAEEAACDWASLHQNVIDSWMEEYNNKKEYKIAFFFCSDDPDHDKYIDMLSHMRRITIPSIYKSEFEIGFKLYNGCTNSNYLKDSVDRYMQDQTMNELIGVVVGKLTNITDVIMPIDGQNLPVFLFDGIGVDTDLKKSTWLSSGNSHYLALALKHFIVNMTWTRVAVISEPTAIAKCVFKDLTDLGGFAYRDHPVNFNLSLADATEVLQTLETENARIIFINTNNEDAALILSAAVELNMNTEEYVWIVREWRPNGESLNKNIKHLTISFSCRCSTCPLIKQGDPLQELRDKIDKIWPECTWPAQAAALGDATLILVEHFKSVFKHPHTQDDTHSDIAFQLFKNSLNSFPVEGITQTLKYKQGKNSLQESVVFVDMWEGYKYRPLARWRVNGTVHVEYEERTVYPWRKPPYDGASKCIWSSGDPYLPVCNDWIWITILVFKVVLPLATVKASRIIRRRIAIRFEKIREQVLIGRQQRAAALSAGYLVDRSTLELRHELGTGRFGRVSLAVLRVPGSTPRYVAAKSLRDQEDEGEILREACTLSSLKHIHIIRLVGVCIDEEPPLVLMEVAFFGDLLQYLRARRYLAERAMSGLSELNTGDEEAVHVSPQALTRLARQAASALGYLSLRGVIHRDLRASNCLVDGSRSLKLADFGMAREVVPTCVDGSGEYICATRGLFPALWMAPESLEHGVFSAASDVWALGVLIFELVTLGARPYGDMSLLRVMRYVAMGGKPPMPRDATRQTVGLARLCWKREPEQRPTAAEVVAYLAEHPTTLRAALDCDHEQPPDFDSGFAESQNQS